MARFLDDLDRNITRELQLRADRSNAQIATKLSVSASTIHRRIVELKSAGILTGVVAIVSPRAAQRETTFVATARLSSTLAADVEPFERWIMERIEVQGAFLMADENAMLLTLRVRASTISTTCLRRSRPPTRLSRRSAPEPQGGPSSRRCYCLWTTLKAACRPREGAPSDRPHLPILP